VVVWKVILAIPLGRIIFAHRCPLPLGEIRTPAFPIFLASRVLRKPLFLRRLQSARIYDFVADAIVKAFQDLHIENLEVISVANRTDSLSRWVEPVSTSLQRGFSSLASYNFLFFAIAKLATLTCGVD
jgi:hypothetical protein